METLLMKGKPVADVYREAVSAKIAAAKEKGIKVTLAIIVVGDDPASPPRLSTSFTKRSL